MRNWREPRCRDTPKCYILFIHSMNQSGWWWISYIWIISYTSNSNYSWEQSGASLNWLHSQSWSGHLKAAKGQKVTIGNGGACQTTEASLERLKLGIFWKWHWKTSKCEGQRGQWVRNCNTDMVLNSNKLLNVNNNCHFMTVIEYWKLVSFQTSCTQCCCFS